MGVDLEAVRTFVAVSDAGQFSEAAAELSITQHAVSKRIAVLEKDLGVWLFTRTPRGAELTVDGQAFLPHARELLQAEERAAASVRPGRRALRVDVISRRIAPAALLRGFHHAHPETELDVVTVFDADTAIAAVRSGAIDATFRALLWPADYGLRRIAVRDPTPVYPHSLVWRNDNPHPALATLRDYLAATRPRQRGDGTWAPGWTRD